MGLFPRGIDPLSVNGGQDPRLFGGEDAVLL